ncbi:flagellin N-terminal helical domain-containing protein [Geochorda subterranea]|uniref:Flagellin n=1 Tax=Geochorda subterranea TaxID=3109564 RepID=A0ABZ1BT87_9FIRM|nr:flagellin [Limnochorda sp. LNt]WRP15783.1 flagellin [Limnochorda sp. LNt]
MRIVNNVMALNSWRNLTVTSGNLAKTLERLSSGLRINRAADDAAGLAISEKMRGQIRGLNQAVRNAQDGISLIQTAEGALNETHAILQRMRELAVQATNDTLTESDREQIQKEINQLTAEVQRISIYTEFNTQRLLDGTYTNKQFHIGANQSQVIQFSIANMGVGEFTSSGVAVGALALVQTGAVTNSAGTTVNEFTFVYYSGTGTLAQLTSTVGYALSVMSTSSAELAISKFNNAIESVSFERSKLGALQNRLEHTINNLSVAAENLTAAESRIRDADMAQEMMNFVRNQILLQSGTAMLAQANAVPQSVLQLLA